MRVRQFVSIALVMALAAPAAAQDAFNLAAAQIVNAPDVRSWRQTAAMTEVWFDGCFTGVKFTKQYSVDRWPDVVPPGWDGPLQYTLWLFLQVNGQWVGSGFVQFWYGRNESGRSDDCDVPSVFDKHWYYGSSWRPMDTHGPIRPGEPIAFMVTSGNARNSVGPMGPMERSNVVIVNATDRGSFTFDGTIPPVSVPPPTPPGPQQPPSTPPTPSVPPPVVSIEPSVAPLLAQAVEILKHIDATTSDTNGKVTEVRDSARTFMQRLGDFGIWVAKYGGPFIGGIVTTWIAMHNPAPATTPAPAK